MRQTRQILLLILTLWIASSQNFFASDVEVEGLLEKVRDTYRDLKSYRFEANFLTEIIAKGKQDNVEMKVSLAIVKPARVRVNIKDERKEILSVSNENTTWLYMDHLKQYTKKDIARGKNGSATDAGPVELSAMINRFAEAYAHLADHVGNASLVREEDLEVGDQSVPCYVLKLVASHVNGTEANVETERTLWIDKTRYVVLKDVSHSETEASSPESVLQLTRTTVFNRVDINELLPHNLFVFQPPDGAEQVENFDLSTVAAGSRAKSEAPDFRLKDLDGHSFHLRSQRGKAVLIEFWASWCGPCRFEMPIVEKFHRRFQQQGLVVVGINDEDPEAAQEFLQDKDFTFSMLVDVGGEVGSAYEVDAIPTLVLIDQEGNIVHRSVGLGNERELREALKKIGFDAHDRS